jgi:hypothetical protein
MVCRILSTQERSMSEVRRRYTCPICQLKFVIAFDEADQAEHASVRIDCPRTVEGHARPAAGPACQGRVEAHDLPVNYRVLPAEG